MKERFLILGRAGSGKTHLVLHKFIQFINHHKDDNVIFILPTYSQVEHLRDHILRISEIKGYFDTNIVTFHGLARRILDDDYLRNPIGESEKNLILSHVFKSINTKYLSRVLDFPGFKRTFLNLIREIKENSLCPTTFKALLEKLQSNHRNPHFSLKCRELAMLYDSYQKTLVKNKLMDKEDFLAQALSYLNENEDIFSQIELLLIDGFHDYTQLELLFIKKLASIVPDVYITLPYQASDSVLRTFQTSHETYSKLTELNLKEKWLVENKRATSPVLRYIEANVFSDSKDGDSKNIQFGKDVEADTSFQIVIAAGMQDEVEQIARRIRHLTYKNGYGFWQIGIILRDVAIYQDVIEDTFTRFNIPVRIYAKNPLRNNPLIKAILNTTKIFTDNWQDEAVWNVLKCNTGMDKDLINRLELAYLSKGKMDDCEKWIEFTSRWKPVSKFLKGLKKYFSSLERKNPFSFYCKWYINIANLFYNPTFTPIDNADGEVAELMKSDAGALREFLAILNNTTLRDFVEDMGDITFDEFSRILDSQIMFTSYKKIDRRRNVVNVINVLEARQWEIPVVFVGGLLEKEFPKQVREDLFFKDFYRKKLNETGKVVMRVSSEQMDEEIYLFYIAITRAKERLYLSYPATNSDGNMTLPSFFLQDIKKLFPEHILQKITVKRNLSGIIPGPEEVINPTDMRNYVYYHFNDPYIPAGKQHEKDIAVWFYNNHKNGPSLREELCELRGLVDSYWNLKPKLYNRKILEKIRDTNSRFNATGLRDFAQCPYKYFGRFTLTLKQAIPMALDSLMQGRIIHKVLEEYFKEIQKKDISKIFEEVFNHETRRIVIGFEELKIKNEMLGTLLAFESVEGEFAGPVFKPNMFEVKFGDEVHNPIEITDGKTGRIEISGKIDRVDVAEIDGEKAGIIIDYKSGKAEFKSTDIEEGTDLQLPIYILALRDVFKITPVAAVFYALKTLKKTGIYNWELINSLKLSLNSPENAFGDEGFNKKLEDTKNHILRFSREIRSGRIELKPHNLDFCGEGNCDFANVCRVDKWRVG